MSGRVYKNLYVESLILELTFRKQQGIFEPDLVKLRFSHLSIVFLDKKSFDFYFDSSEALVVALTHMI